MRYIFKKSNIIIFLVIIVTLSVLSVFMIKRNKYIEVKTYNVKRDKITSYLSTTGIIKSNEYKDYFASQLKIKKVNVNIGDKVNKGQILVEFDNTDINNNVKQAEIQYKSALIQKKELQNNADDINNKIENLNKEINKLEKENKVENFIEINKLKMQRDNIQPISKERLDIAQNSIEVSKLAFENAKSKANGIKANIIADFDGVITNINSQELISTNPTLPIITLQNLDDLKIVLNLNKDDAIKIYKNQKAIIYGINKNYDGEVSFISPTAKQKQYMAEAQSYLEVNVAFKEKPTNFKIDFNVDVDIIVEEKDNTLIVPAQSVKLSKEDNYLVYTVENGVIKEKTIDIGIQSDLNYEVVNGLNEDEKIILNINDSIKPEIKVKEIS